MPAMDGRGRLALLLAVASLCAFAPSDAPPHLTILTWNIQQPAFTDWDTRREDGVWPTMIGEGADIMCLQEVTPKQLIQTLCHFADQGLSYDYIGYGRAGSGVKVEPKIRERAVRCESRDQRYNKGGEHCAILWNEETYEYDPLDDVGFDFTWDGYTPPREGQAAHTFWLTNDVTRRWTPGARFQAGGPIANPEAAGKAMANASLYRICTWGRFRHRGTGRRVIVYNAHLDHFSPAARRSAVRQILEHVHEVSDHTDDPIVLAGDFNATPFSPEIRFVTHGDTDPTDPFLHVSVLTMRNVSGTAPTFGSGLRRIDYIFTSGGLRSRSHEVIQPNGKSSDHRPVRVDLDFDPKPRPPGGEGAP